MTSNQPILAKICGLTTKPAVFAAIENGADFIGLVFFDKSPRNIGFDAAKDIVDYARTLSTTVQIVAVIVAPDGELLKNLKTIGIDWVQVHKINSVERLDEIKAFGFKVIMAFGISDQNDLVQIKQFDGVVDYILFDAKAPKGATNEGGFGVSFDWSILDGLKTKSPWILSGGLTPMNVLGSIAATNADFVDVSSGIESSLGIKDITKIENFLKAVKGPK
jgi:phosphoribosylanthranilate isomerase